MLSSTGPGTQVVEEGEADLTLAEEAEAQYRLSAPWRSSMSLPAPPPVAPEVPQEAISYPASQFAGRIVAGSHRIAAPFARCR